MTYISKLELPTHGPFGPPRSHWLLRGDSSFCQQLQDIFSCCLDCDLSFKIFFFYILGIDNTLDVGAASVTYFHIFSVDNFVKLVVPMKMFINQQ